MGKKSNYISSIIALLQAKHSLVQSGGKASGLGGKEKNGMYIWNSSFWGWGLPEGLISVLSDSDKHGELAYFRRLGAQGWENKGRIKRAQRCNVVPENLQYCTQTPEGAINDKPLKNWFRKLTKLSNWEITHTSQEKMHPQRFSESLPRLISESLSQSIKTGRGGCFLKCTNHREKEKESS